MINQGNVHESSGVSKVYSGSEGRYLPPKQKYQPPPKNTYFKEQPFPVSAEGTFFSFYSCSPSFH